jgi:hypothetical protein
LIDSKLNPLADLFLPNIDQFPLFFHNENLTENIACVDKKGNKTRFHLFLQFSFAHFVYSSVQFSHILKMFSVKFSLWKNKGN